MRAGTHRIIPIRHDHVKTCEPAILHSSARTQVGGPSN
jgi:hypothetical protein